MQIHISVVIDFLDRIVVERDDGVPVVIVGRIISVDADDGLPIYRERRDERREPDGGTASVLTREATSAPLAPATADQAPAWRIVPADAYRIYGEHARGGIGRVLRAEDRHLRRPVALKELIEDSVGARRRF